MSAGRGVAGFLAVACAFGALSGGASAGSAELELQLIDQEGGDSAVNLLTTFYLDGGRFASGPRAIEAFLARRSAIELYLLDLSGEQDVMLDVGLRYYVPGSRMVSIDARVWNPTDATLGSTTAVYGYENPTMVLNRAAEFAGENWNVGMTAWLGPNLALSVPLIGGTLDEDSTAESLAVTADWIKLRLVSGSARPAADVSFELSIEDDVDCYIVRGMAYPDSSLGVGMQLWFIDNELDSYEIVASYGAASTFGRFGALIEEDTGDVTLRLAVGARF